MPPPAAKAARPPVKQVAFHAAVAALVVMAMVVVGLFARGLYVAVTHPGPGWVVPLTREMRAHPWHVVYGLGVAAAVAEAVFSFSGMRARHCRAYVSSSAPQ